MNFSITAPAHPRHAWRAALLSAALTATLMATGSSWASVEPGTKFGAVVNAGGLRQGGWYQESASASYAPDSNASATASAYIQGLSLHALAWTSENPKLPSYCTVLTCTWQTFADADVWETLYITAPANAAETMDWDFTIDGTKTRGKWAYGDGAYASASYYFGLDPNGWYNPRKVSLGNFETQLKGTMTATAGTTFVAYLYGSLSVSARSGSIADYSHTMAFHLDLPEGWTYTSASGRFSPAPSPVPEPTSLAMMRGGLLGIGALKRRSQAR